MNTPKTRWRKPFCSIATLPTLLLALLAAGPNSRAADPKLRVLFYGPTFWPQGVMEQFLNDHAAEYEPVARDLNGNLEYSTTASQVWTPGAAGNLNWSTKTISDFQGFDLIVIDEGPEYAIEDPAAWAGAINNRAVWGAAVVSGWATGKRTVIYAGDPTTDQHTQFAGKCLETGAERTAGYPTGPGLVIMTSHVYASARSPVDPNQQAIAHLLSYLGTFEAIGDNLNLCQMAYEACSHPANDCFDPFSQVAWTTAIAGSSFRNWPSSFVPVMVRRSPQEWEAPSAVLPDGLGLRGVASLLARGKWEQLTAHPTCSSKLLGQTLAITVNYRQMLGGTPLSGRALQLSFVGGPSLGRGSIISTTDANGVATFNVTSPASSGEDLMIISDGTGACVSKLGVRCTWAPIAVTVSPVSGRTSTSETNNISAKFRFTRTGGTAANLQVNVQLLGAATLGADYYTVPALALNGQSPSIQIPLGESTADLEICAYPDSRREGTESVVCTVREGYPSCAELSPYAVGTPSQASVLILDDPADNWQIPYYWYLYDLGTLGGEQSWALGVSEAYFDTDPATEAGVIVGGSWWQMGNGNSRGFSYQGTVEANVLTGTMSGIPSAGIAWSEAMGTEMFGNHLVGRYSPNGIQIRPFLYNRGEANLLQLPIMGGNAEAVAISWPQYPVGSGVNFLGDWRAIAWNPNDNYTALDLTTLVGDFQGYQSYAYGVNNNGRVVGKSQVPSGAWHAFRTALSPFGDFAPQAIYPDDDLGTLLGIVDSGAHGINDLDEVVGQSGGYAVLWSLGNAPPPQRLYCTSGNGYCRAQAINNLGVAVGCRTTSPIGSPDRAVLWWNHNTPSSVDLSSLSVTIPGGGTWDLRLASGINDNNWIVGWGYRNGQPHAFLLKPQQIVD